jgi:hypothetical protein
VSRPGATEWMPFYGDRFFGSERVLAMEPAAQALYLRALWRQWTHGPLPSSEAVLVLLFPAFAATWDRLWPQVSPMFVEAAGRLSNETCATMRAETDAAVEARRRGAAKTNAQRTLSERSSSRSAHAERSLGEERRGEGEERTGEEIPSGSEGGSAAQTASTAEEPKPKRARKATEPVSWEHVLQTHEGLGRLRASPDLAALEAFWPTWEGYRRDIKKPLGERSVVEQFRSAQDWGIHVWIKQARASIANGYVGVFEERNGHSAQPPPKFAPAIPLVDAPPVDRRKVPPLPR